MTPSAHSIWDTLLPVIIGGGIGVIGGLAGPPLSHWLAGKAETRRVRTEKFEELLSLIYQQIDWMSLLANSKMFGDKDLSGANPLSKAQAIAAIHFPDLNEELMILELKSTELKVTMLDFAIEGKSYMDKGASEKYKKQYNMYLKQYNLTLQRLKKYKV